MGPPRGRFSLQRSHCSGHIGALIEEAVLQPLNPREIQARVRAGESPDVIAAECGWPLDRVMRYAEPLLGERAYIAGLARNVELRKSRGGATLEQTALDIIKTTDPEALTWDAYKDSDSRWIVTAVMGSSTATWSYDVTGRSVQPLDAGARKLMGVGDESIDALDVIADRPIAPTETVILEHPVHADRPRLVSVPAHEDPHDDTEQGPSDEYDEHSSREIVTTNDQTASHDQLDLVVPPRSAPVARKPKPKKGRASIPSWDEILFGATKAPRDE